MFGIDLGLNVASVTEIRKGEVVNSLVFKFSKEKELEGSLRAMACVKRMVSTITAMSDGNPSWVAVEEPIYSWGRKNPKGFAKSVALFTLLETVLRQKGYKVLPVNNKTAKRLAGSGSKDKEEMIKAYKRETGKFPGHQTQYGKETLADSYFIAVAGLDQLRQRKDGRV